MQPPTFLSTLRTYFDGCYFLSESPLFRSILCVAVTFFGGAFQNSQEIIETFGENYSAHGFRFDFLARFCVESCVMGCMQSFHNHNNLNLLLKSLR